MTDYRVAQYVSDIRAIVGEEQDERRIVERIRPLAQRLAATPGWITDEHRRCDETQGFGVHLLHEARTEGLAQRPRAGAGDEDLVVGGDDKLREIGLCRHDGHRCFTGIVEGEQRGPRIRRREVEVDPTLSIIETVQVANIGQPRRDDRLVERAVGGNPPHRAVVPEIEEVPVQDHVVVFADASAGMDAAAIP